MNKENEKKIDETDKITPELTETILDENKKEINIMDFAGDYEAGY